MKRLGQLVLWPAIVGFIAMCCATAQAQFTEGALVGTVPDPSGAVVAGATVEVTEVQTRISTEVKADSTGFDRALHLQFGANRVRVR
jgi:hypothetical protein